ncbi:MAG: Asp-tRNA(Asn)/Glu-tRNA(Gln) amidotransferase GatCAB subunit A, partial [Actinomycetes bacterium]
MTDTSTASTGSLRDSHGLVGATAAELAASIAAGDVSAVEVTQAHLDRISAVDPEVHAFL